MFNFTSIFYFNIFRGNNGLVIDQSLTEGHTNRCDTFNNEPLSVNQDFQISSIEIISFDCN